jgi:hypothetical protein
MASIPHAARPVVNALAPAFTRPTALRVSVLLFAAILTVGRRTVSNLLRTAGALAPGHPSSYQRVFSHRRWRPWRLGRALAGLVLALVPEGQPVPLVGDDTVEEHRGKHVHGKGRHRDPVRSTHAYLAWRWGHLWVVLCVLVKLPGAARLWALPVLVALYRTPEENRRRGKPHKTPPDLMRQLTAVLLRGFPEKTFTLAVDGAYACHALARFAHRHRERLTLVSKFYANAALYDPPPAPAPGHRGRPRVKGDKRPSPQEVVEKARRRHREVDWYGGGRRKVGLVTGTGHWHKGGEGLVPVRWVYVEDESGTHRPEYFFTTDLALKAERVVECYTGRWNIETTFQEARESLGFGTTRGHVENTVLREGPCLLCLYTIVVLLYGHLPPACRHARTVDWPGKHALTFSDALTAVRRYLWRQWLFESLFPQQPLQKLPRRVREFLLHALVPAA